MTKHQDDTAEATPSTGKRQRIAKLMARVGLCSRRDAEAWIREGRVSLNGEVLTTPAIDVDPDDDIRVDGAPLPRAEKTRLFLFHKPRGLVTSDHDPEGRPTVADFLHENWPDGPRVVTIGRLDINTEGLLLLTNDGGLARTLELPQTGWLRRYRVRAKGTIDQARLDALAGGISIDGIDYAGIEAKLDRVQGANCWLTMGLREGKNREIKRVLEHLGLEVNRLIRLSFGPFQLGDIEEGAVEEVRTRVLRDQLGPQLAAEAGVDLAPQESSVASGREAAERDERPRRAGTRPGGEKRPGTDKREATDRRRADAPRTRRGAPAEESPPRRERPIVGPRRHVSVLRDAEAREVKAGPRKRIERTDTKDRNDRVVQVERRVSTRPAAVPLATRGRAATTRRKGDDREALPSRGDRPRHMSPSALAKRVRTERSGGEARRHEAPETGRAPRREREPQRAPRTGASDRPREARSPRPEGGGPRGEARVSRPERATTRPPRQGGERSVDAKRPRSEGGPRQRDEAPRRGREAREAPRPERGRPRDASGAERQGGPKRFERTGRTPDRETTPRGGARERGPGQDRPPRRDSAPKGRPGAGRPAANGKGPGAKRSSGGKPGGGKPGGFRPGGRAGGDRPGGGKPGGGRTGGGRPGGAKPGRPKPRG